MHQDIKSEIDSSESTASQESQESSNALAKCLAEVNEWKDRCLRLNAEFENYKKRELRERQQWEKFAQQDIIKALLPVIDNMERAFNQQQSMPEEAKPWVAGFELIAKEFTTFLDKIGVQQIQEITTFDPELHEAVMQVAESQQAPGTIITVFEKGYRFKGSVIRPARVSVAS